MAISEKTIINVRLPFKKGFISPYPQDVVGCVCVNPGRLTKGQVGGTYGRLLIQRGSASDDGKRVSPCLTAQVVKI